MTAEKYKLVKEIFLAACDRPKGEVGGYLDEAAAGDAGNQAGGVESLLAEHQRNSKVIPEEPEGPLGGVSALLSGAGIDVGDGDGVNGIRPRAEAEQPAASPAQAPPAERIRMDETRFLEDAHDQTAGTHSGIVDAGRFTGPEPSWRGATASLKCWGAGAWERCTERTTSR